MVRIADCNCDDEDAADKVKAFCDPCFRTVWNYLKNADWMVCAGCGMTFKPARSYFADLVRVNR